ncbi:hypothetical protein PR048_016037 [Dryococelus australis]|uniref:Uncharacterized protein n=1 Tax=Dryococelus australis TaxID=614101 RepID=A0ABQ9HIS9_9NEOP|nr:hypothetical protein PR048_016037 [Dryococelus australis]
MLGLKDPSGILMHWSLQLSEYVYKIQYCPGRKHENADCTIRRVRLIEASAEENLSAEQQNDEECQLFRQQSRFVQQEEILKECYDLWLVTEVKKLQIVRLLKDIGGKIIDNQ